jgi:hypothetical protein
VDADRRVARVRLPPLPLAVPASVQLDAEEPAPEAPRPIGVIGGKLDQRQLGGDHRGDDRGGTQSHAATAPRAAL